MYDIIGDIHGYADELEMLLASLGYEFKDGVWQHPERVLISVGDLIDRGPQQKRTVDIIRSMGSKGFAKVIMGNHEFNAISYYEKDENGNPLRAHTEKNRKQHQAFLDEAESCPDWYSETITWFKELPLLLDLQDLRVVHACWDSVSVSYVKEYCTDNFILESSSFKEANDPEKPLYDVLEKLLKGCEIALPNGISFNDKDGHPRTCIRIRWWEEENITYRDLAIGIPDTTLLPDDKVPLDEKPSYDNDKPLFIGHYWLRDNPGLLSNHIACVDYSVAQPGGFLVAYRFDDKELSNNQFIAVPARPEGHFSIEQLQQAFIEAGHHSSGAVDKYHQIAEGVRTALDNKEALYDAIAGCLKVETGAEAEAKHVIAVMRQLALISSISSK